MKLMILGIDGGDWELIRKLEMPFLKRLIKESSGRELNEDLISRGWAEILTGQHAADTKALYMRPKLDGTFTFTTSFGVKDILSNKDVTPLWKTAENMGKSVGFMNVPTTGPAPEVKGFLVAGGGGGVDKVGGVPTTLIHPQEIMPVLNEEEYEVDLRLTSSGITSFEELVKILNRMVQKRAKSFCRLVSQYDPDLGFPCFRVSTTLQYLAMSELQAIFAAKDMPELASSGNGEYSFSRVQELLWQHFKILDDAIREVFERAHPENYILTSDHGCVPYLHHANADAILLETGFQNPVPGLKGTAASTFKSLVKSLVPGKWLGQIMKTTPKVGKMIPARFDALTTRAFSNYYMQGVYINDERFQSAVSKSQIDSLVDELCGVINEHPVSQKHEMHAYPYRRKYSDRKFEAFLPDIHIQKPDSMFFTNQGEYVSRNLRYGPLDEDISRATDMHSGQKGRRPLYYFNSELESLDPKDLTDLTAVYELANRALRS